MNKKILVMVRHAKSSWADANTRDYDRPLNDRGERDAPLMGQRLKELGIQPDLIISSSAKRARQTARRIAGGIGYDKEQIHYEEQLYHCMPPTFEEVIYGIDDQINTVVIVAHNPGITEFTNQLSPKYFLDHMPTCGAVAAYINTDHWHQFATAAKEVFLFERPKKEA